VESPGGNTNQLRITESRNGGSAYTNLFTYSASSNHWELLLPDQATTLRGKTNLVSGQSIQTTDYLTGANVGYRQTRVYGTNYWNGAFDVLLQTSEGLGADTRATTYTYYTTGEGWQSNLLKRVD
jgi:hypothetical protein